MSDSDIRCARAGLSQIIEPADSLAVHALDAWGPLRVVEIIAGSTPTQRDWITLKAINHGDGNFASMLRKNSDMPSNVGVGAESIISLRQHYNT